ncbi:uncharacterized protein Fot_51536 [Forsythia ovata]|uniref:Uncharacterized protein n=1 Tax=Forsythia ovata TaxID=205694 RepID=A0ABD1PZT1_9LAMI
MDLLVVATAAGAGYIAKNWQKISAKKEGLTGPSSKSSLSVQSKPWNLLQQIRDKTCPLSRLARERAQGYVNSEEKNDLDRRNYEDNDKYEFLPIHCILTFSSQKALPST